MSYGLSIFNGSGSLIFDSSNLDHIPYQIFTSGTTGSVSGASSENFRPVLTNVSGFNSATDLIFIKPTGNPAGVGAYIEVGPASFIIHSNSNTSFYYYIFRPSNDLPSPTSEYGLQVFNENGEQIFNSDLLMARIKGRLSGSNASISGSSLFSTATMKYSAITTDIHPHRGVIRGWYSLWGSSSVSLMNGVISPYGPSVTVPANDIGSTVPEAIWEYGFHVDLTSPVHLLITAGNP